LSSLLVRFRLAILVLVVAVVCPRPALGQAASMEEPKVKANFLFNFARFADWPEDQLAPAAPISVCVADPAVASAFEGLAAGRSIGTHPLKMTRVKIDDSIRTCMILYVGKLDSKKQDQLIALLSGTSTLTVGDAEDFAVRGGMIGLFVSDGKMKFAVNRDAVQRTRITLSSQLLNVAKLVRNAP
jgi:hypothetical protein